MHDLGCGWEARSEQRQAIPFIILVAFFVEVMRSFIAVLVICIFLEILVKKKTMELFGYAIARAK